MKKIISNQLFLELLFLFFSLYARSQNEIAISNADDLQKIGVDSNYPIDGNYYLTQDIDLGGISDWIPIGSTNGNDRFKGILDGKGYSIKNLTISSSTGFKGLFCRLYGATVKDLDLVNVNIRGTSPIGAVSGAMIGGSKIERVSVCGTIEGETEVGGIVGRIARDPTKTDYNVIQDCYVSANINATKLSTDMNSPSCAGGIAAYVHSNIGNQYAKIEIRRSYFTGSVKSAQMNHISGNAAGILAFYDNNQYVKMSELLVLADEITAATPNYFFCRRGILPENLELLEKLYVRDDLVLSYYDNNDKGYGVAIPAGIIDTLPLNTFKTRQFYNDNLSWDFENVWTITEGSFPVLKRETGTPTNISSPDISKNYFLIINQGKLIIDPLTQVSVSIFNLTGLELFSSKNLNTKAEFTLPKGAYIVSLICNGQNFCEKVIIK
jgi:hypothetical protein